MADRGLQCGQGRVGVVGLFEFGDTGKHVDSLTEVPVAQAANPVPLDAGGVVAAVGIGGRRSAARRVVLSVALAAVATAA